MGPIEAELRNHGCDWFSLSAQALRVLADARTALGLDKALSGREGDVVIKAIALAKSERL